jgi:hypothetical protein
MLPLPKGDPSSQYAVRNAAREGEPSADLWLGLDRTGRQARAAGARIGASRLNPQMAQ